MDYSLIIFVLTGALLGVSSAQTHQYYFVSTPLNWTSAQSFCRQDYTDLVTIENTADVDAVINTSLTYTGLVWIGLHDDFINSWKWSLSDSSFYGEGQTTFRNWYLNQPNNLNGQQYCVTLLSGSPFFGTWDDVDCSLERHFVCYNGTTNGSPSYVVSGTSLNWTEAQKFCRENYVDLASVRNQTDNTIIANLAAGDFVWIGLSRQKVWSDGSNSSFQFWVNGQPNSGPEQCVAAAMNDSGRWSDEDCALSLPFICYAPTPHNAEDFRASGQNETSITLQWNKLNNISSFIFQFNGTETNISAPDGPGVITHTVSSLTAGTKYTFTLIYVSHGVRSNIIQLTAITAPSNPESLKPLNQTETSITLQWNKANNTNFVLELTGSETSITAPDGDGAVTHTVSSLTAGSKYTFTLFSVFENIRSSGVSITAATAPVNAEGFGSSAQTETSITLQWNKVNNTNFVLQFNDTETNISAPDGAGAVTHTVSSLTAGTKYTFTLFSVFENIRSSGVSITAATGPHFVFGINVRLESLTRLSETELEDAVAELFRKYGVPPEVSISVRSVKP